MVLRSLALALMVASGCRKAAPVASVPVASVPLAAPAAPAAQAGPTPDGPARTGPTSVSLPVAPDRVGPPMVVIDRLRTASTSSLRVSQGGRWVLADVGGGVVQIFEASSGRLVLERDTWPWTPCTYQPFASNGRRILVRSAERVRLLDAWTGEVVIELTLPGDGQIACTLSGDGTRAVVARGSRLGLRGMDGAAVLDLDLPPGVSPDVLLADDDADTLVVAGADSGGTAGFVWGGEGGRRWRRLVGIDATGPLVMSETGAWLVGPRGAGSALWRLWTGEVGKTWAWPRVHAFSDHDARALVEGQGGALSLVDVAKDVALATLPAVPGLSAAAMGSDGQRVVVASGDRAQHRLGAWSLEDGQPRFARSDARHRVRSVAWVRDQLTVRGDGALYFSLDTTTAACSQVEAVGPGKRWVGVRWAGRFEPRYAGREVVVSDTGRGTTAWSHRYAARVRAAATDFDGGRIVVLTSDAAIHVHSAEGGAELPAFLPEGDARPVALTTHPRRAELIALLSDGSVVSRSLQTGDDLRRWPIDPPVGPGRKVAVSSDGGVAAVGGDYGIAVLAIAETPSRNHFLPASPPVLADLAVSDAGSRVVVTDGTDVTVWDVASEALVATIVPLSDCAVVLAQGHGVCAAASRASLRWRQGLELIPRGTPEAEAAWTEWRLPALSLVPTSRP